MPLTHSKINKSTSLLCFFLQVFLVAIPQSIQKDQRFVPFYMQYKQQFVLWLVAAGQSFTSYKRLWCFAW